MNLSASSRNNRTNDIKKDCACSLFLLSHSADSDPVFAFLEMHMNFLESRRTEEPLKLLRRRICQLIADDLLTYALRQIVPPIDLCKQEKRAARLQHTSDLFQAFGGIRPEIKALHRDDLVKMYAICPASMRGALNAREASTEVSA